MVILIFGFWRLFVGVYIFLPLSILRFYLWSALFAIQSGNCKFPGCIYAQEAVPKGKNITGF